MKMASPHLEPELVPYDYFLWEVDDAAPASGLEMLLVARDVCLELRASQPWLGFQAARA